MSDDDSNAGNLRTARSAAVVLAIVVVATLIGCGAPGPLMPEQRTSSTAESRPPPAPEAYKVRSGDTLYSIAFGYGLDWRRVARWNSIAAPYTIHVGDWLRLQAPPDMRPAVVAAETPKPRPPAGTDGQTGSESTRDSAREARRGSNRDAVPVPVPVPESNPVPATPDRGPESPPAEDTSPGAQAEPTEPSSSSTRQATPDPAPVPDAATRNAAGVVWRWPTAGAVARGFNTGASRKGILIAGEQGQPIRAAADGEVVYSGNGLIGYGELIIVKHSDRMLSAYAHNRERLIGEGEQVRSGQLIARMGSNERDEFVLHFEIRRDGKPDNPVNYLPPR